MTTTQQGFYCVFDRHDGSVATSFVDQTLSYHEVGTADGWYVNLTEMVGERDTEPAVIAAGSVFFTSYAPFAEPCLSGGESFFYRLDYDDGETQEVNSPPGQRRFRGGGIASRPVIDLVNGTVTIQFSYQTIAVQDIGSEYATLWAKAWQEDYSRVGEPPATEGNDEGTED